MLPFTCLWLKSLQWICSWLSVYYVSIKHSELYYVHVCQWTKNKECHPYFSHLCFSICGIKINKLYYGGQLLHWQNILVLCVVLLCVFTFWVPCRHISYDFRIKMIFGSSLPAVYCRRTHVLFTLFVFVWVYVGVQYRMCCVFVLFFFVLCTLCRLFLWNVHFWLRPLVFSKVCL